MDKIYSEAMEEKELTLPTQRRSSILKLPRSPLRDLGSGNEIIQDVGTVKGRKSSRRVSFAETIKVFQRSPDSNSEDQPEDSGKTAEEGENIPLSQKERPEDMLWEISGMDTLLNAPIQAPLQQTEGPTGDPAYGDRPATDRTVVFADENQMDLTASHTVMISQGLLERTEESKKIDTKSFLASLKDNTAGSERSERCGFSSNPNEAADEYVFQMEPNLSSEKKFNFSDLLSRLRPGQPTSASGNGPDTENTLTSLRSRDPGSDVSPGQEDSSYRTRLFGEQDDGMDITQHHSAVIQTFGPPGSEALLKPGECRGGTLGGPEDFMDLTVNQTGPILSSGHEPSDRENRGSEVTVGLTGNPGVCGIPPQDPSPEDPTVKADNEMDITRSHTVVIDNHTMPQAAEGPAPTWPGTAFPGAWAVFDASPEEASENPGSFSPGAVSKNPLGPGQSYTEMPPKTERAAPASSGPSQKPFPLGGRVAVPGLDAAEETEGAKRHAVAVSLQDKEEAASQKAGSQTEAPLDAAALEREEALEGPGAGIPSRRPMSPDATGRGDVEMTTSHTLDINSRALKPALKGSSRGPEQLRKSLALSSSTSSVRGFAFLEAQQGLGRPPSHPTVTDLGAGPAVPKGDDTVPASIICKPQSGLPDRAFFTPDSSDKDFTQSQAGPIKQDGSGLDFSQAQPTANSEKTISTAPGHCSWPEEMPSKGASIAKPLASEKTQEFSEGDMELTRCHTTTVEGKNVLGDQRAVRTNPPGLVDKTVVFADDLDDLELTRSHTVNIDFKTLEKVKTPEKSTSELVRRTGLAEPAVLSTGSDRTVFFSEDDEGDMEITQRHSDTVGGKSFLLGQRQESGMLPLAAEKTVVFSDNLEDVELTRSHTVNIDFKTLEKKKTPEKSTSELVRRTGLAEPVVLSTGSDRTVFFSEDDEGDMEITQRHSDTVGGKSFLLGQRQESGMLPLAAEKTVVFSDNLEDVELTRSHTVNIDFKTLEKKKTPEKSTSELVRRTGLAEPVVLSTGSDRTIFFSEDDEGDMEITQRHSDTVGGKSFLLGQRQESGALPLAAEKTVVFSDNLEDLELTRSHTVNIDFKTLEKKKTPEKSTSELVRRTGLAEPVVLSTGSDRTVFFSEDDEGDMEITQRHSDTVGGKSFLLGERQESGMLPLAAEKTVVFSDSLEDLELTRSHTVNIDFKTLEKKTTPEKSTSELVRRTGLTEPVVLSTGSDRTVFFSEDDEGDMEITQRHSDTVGGKSFLLGQRQESGTLPLAAEKTVVFSDNLEDLELTRSHTVNIDFKVLERTAIPDKSTAEVVRRTGSAEPVVLSTGRDKTVLFSEDDEGDMEITKGHVIVGGGKTLLTGEQQESGVLTVPAEKTVVFGDHHDDLELTRSHTVKIDYQTLEKPVIPDKSTSEVVRRTGLAEPKMVSSGSDKTIFFSGDGEGDMEITQRHTDPVGDKSSLPGEQQESGIVAVPAEKTVAFADDLDDLELTRSHTVNIDFKILERTMIPDKSTSEVARTALTEPKMASTGNDKTTFFSGDGENDMEITQRQTDTESGQSVLLGTQQESGILTAPAEKTVVFADELDDLELTRSHTVNIDFKIPERTAIPDKSAAEVGRRRGSVEPKMVSACGDNTIFFSGDGEGDMEITRRRTDAVGGRRLLPGTRQESGMPPVPAKKTVVLSDNLDDLELTRSHTVNIDFKIPERSVMTDKSAAEVDRRTGLAEPKMASALSDRTVFLSEDGSDAVGLPKRHDVPPGGRQASGALTAPAEKAAVFSDNLDSLEPTGSRTADPVYETSEKTRIRDKCPSEGNRRKSLAGPKTEPSPDDSPQKCQTLALGQDLEKVVKPKSKRVSFKLPEGRLENFPDEAGESQGMETPEDDVFTSPLPPGLEEKGHDVSSPEASKPPGPVGGHPVAACENESQMFHAAQEPDGLGERKGKENVPAPGGDSAGGDPQTKSDPPAQMDPIPSGASQLPDPKMPSPTSGITNIKVQLRNMKRKSEVISPARTDPESNVPEQSSAAARRAEEYVPAAKSRDRPSTSGKWDPRGERKSCPKDGDLPERPVLKERSKVGRHSLGVFLPRLPNKRNSSVTGMEGPEERSAVPVDRRILDSQPSTSQAGNFAFLGAQLRLSPARYISEEFLPGAPEEMDSLDAWEETGRRESPARPGAVQEASGSHKRSRQLEDADKHREKKIRKTGSGSGGAAQPSHQAEDHKGKSPPSLLAKSLSRTPASCSSSLDSTKAEGSSMDFSMQRSSYMESQFPRDSMCEENLKEKLKDGRITVGEFFTLLQVHILIQKPRQSKLPGNCALSAPSSPEDLFMSQYVYRPKIQIYEEDCQALRQTIEELKLCAKGQDKLLVDVNRSLWEVMRGCSDEELKTFGEDLNKMKSRFTKKSKLLAHQRKVALYSKLVQSCQVQWEKLQNMVERTDGVLEEVDSSLAVLQIETEILEQCEEDASPDSDCDVEWKCGMRAVKQELESLQTQEEELLRSVADLKREKQQALSTMSHWQEETRRAEKWINKLTFSEWEIKEWNSQQATFTFLYDSLDLTFTFGEPMGDSVFNDKPCRSVIDVNFESQLDVDRVPPSTLLVHRLIFQFIEEQGSWKEAYPTQLQIPKMLHDFSLVVSRCRLLGDEVEFLSRWGPKYNLIKIAVNGNEVKLLFSSTASFAKFELTMSLSANYPMAPLPFTFQNRIGKISQEDVAAVLSRVPLGSNYLKTAVQLIHRDLLQGPPRGSPGPGEAPQ
ncbi:kinetochore scaffold 1 [Tachyglossus aculeatus]|uniref:kinetochore scaffold 1 n=1 Tax=Tachyglossus aculeatus TaxID=9261 RepID=UPI0018F51C40|nr:kinetochore scaffold 1 [Tachyglossus aculeatus]